MAQSLETILGKTINSTKELRAEINALKDSLVQAEKGSEEWWMYTRAGLAEFAEYLMVDIRNMALQVE